MSEILLTPRPEPVSPIDPDMRPLARAPSQSTEFFNSVFVDSTYSGTRPLRVVKKASPGNMRTSTVSVPSSPVSIQSSETHPHQAISKLFLTMDLDRKPSLSSRSDVHLALGTAAVARPGPSPPMTPDLTPTVCRVTSPITPPRPRGRHPASPVTPSRAPAKALKLLGAQGPIQPPPRQKKKRDHFRPLPNSTLVEIERFFGNVPRKPSKSTSTKNLKSTALMDTKSKNVGGGIAVRHQGEDVAMWLEVEEEQEFAWLMSDPSVRGGGRTDMGRYASDEEDWGMRAFSNVLAVPTSKNKRVDESFVDLFETEKVKSKPSKPRLKGKGRPSFPHPWSAAALSDSSSTSSSATPPALVSRNTEPSSSGSSSSGPPSPDSDTALIAPPRRPKKRPPPLVLDLKPKSNLPIVILNSPPAQAAMKKPLTPIRVTRPSNLHAAQTPFVHPRRAPKPIPKTLELDLTKAALPRTTDTRMPLLPPLPIVTPEDELPISVFEPVTPTDAKYGQIDLPDKKGGWLKKVVRDFGQVKL